MHSNSYFSMLSQAMQVRPYTVFLAVACILTLLRYFISNTVDLNVLYNEEVSIYLHAAEKSFLDLFMIPDGNYINFISKFCAFISLKVFKAIDSFPIVQNLVNWFVAAYFSAMFLSKRFEILIPCLGTRLLLCICLYLIPIYDMHMVFSQGYYLFYGLLYYLILLSGRDDVTVNEVLFVVLTSPFVIFSKPVFFVFGFAFLGLFLLSLHACMKGCDVDAVKRNLLVYILALYAFQAWFTLVHVNYISAHAAKVGVGTGGSVGTMLFFLKKGLVFLGYGLVYPFAHIVSPRIANVSCYLAGCIVVIFTFINIFLFINKKAYLHITVIFLLSLSVILCMYGALSVNFLYDRFFMQDIFSLQWGHRMIFPVIVFSIFNTVFFIQESSFASSKCFLMFLLLICVMSYVVPAWSTWNTGFKPSFSWEQTRPLLNEKHSFIPHAYGIHFYYIRGLYFVSDEIPMEMVGKDTLAATGIPAGRKIKYVMLKQVPDVGAMALEKSSALHVAVDGVDYTAELVNPGANDQYLFKFSNFVPSEALDRVVLSAPELSLAGKAFSFYAVGL